MDVAAFRPGFRFSPMDGAVLVLGAAGVAFAARHSLELAILGAAAVLHFFLFCNVFRVARVPELVWSGLFLAGVGAHTVFGLPWSVVGGAVTVLTVLVIGRELRKPSYHGVLWRRINPGLESWWREREERPPL